MLSEYDLEIRHLKGSANGRADTLSRRPDYDQGSKDNENVTVLPNEIFARATIIPEEIPQDKEQIQAWVDPHKLKQINEYGITKVSGW